MHRRRFLTGASGLGFAVTGCTTQSKTGLAAVAESVESDTVQSNDGATVHPWESDVMKAFPPPPGQQVTRENQEENQRNLRWAMQHLRELYPTQRVGRRGSPVVVLPRTHRDLMDLRLNDTEGQATTLSSQLRALSIDAFVVLHRGGVLCEEYFHGMRPDTPHTIYSMNKSIVASVIATLLGDGLLKLDAVIEKHVPELKDTAYAGATIRQILDMESGVLYRYVEENDEVAQHEQAISPVAIGREGPIGEYNFIPTLKAEASRKHGERMRYKESDPCVLVWAAEKVTGKRFADLLSERIWSKLGAEFDLDAVCDPLGHWTYHLACTLRDIARWGVMCLNQGHFNGQQIIPEEFFVDISTHASVERLANSELTGDFFPKEIGYRSFFYHHEKSGGAIAAAGAYGQFCYMNPSHDVVIAFFSSSKPWSGQLAAGIPFDEVFAQDQRNERERWHLCHEVAKQVG